MRLQLMLTILVMLGTFMGCEQTAPVSFSPDFSSPEQALQSLEDAYRTKNLDNVLMCKDFKLEARFLMKQQGPRDVSDEMVARYAKTPEKQFARRLADGFPEWSGVKARIIRKKELSEEMVVLTEELALPNEEEMTQEILVGKSTDGWKVLVPYNKPTHNDELKAKEG
jgi:hypothetical protein